MKIKVFVGSVQEELLNERLAIAELLNADSFLSHHVEAVLFENLPASPLSAKESYLDALNSSDVYLGILGYEYGKEESDGLSATHREYLHAKKLKMPILVFVKGHSGRDKDRQNKMRELFSIIRHPEKGHKYKRFSNYQELKREVRETLVSILREKGIEPSSLENTEFEQTLESSSDFDTQFIDRADWTELDYELMSMFSEQVLGRKSSESDIKQTLINRGMIWLDSDSGVYRPTAAGWLLFAEHPDSIFPQARIIANSYAGKNKDNILDRRDIRQPLSKAVEEAFGFLARNMRHTTRVRGFSRIDVHEYPFEVIRESIVNAVVHRDYTLSGVSISVEKYSDRIVILNPGLPPSPITVEKLNLLDYAPCSRNPNVARGLSFFEHIEEQGDGIRRIVNTATSAGLPRPKFSVIEGRFAVVLYGPKTMEEIRVEKLRPTFEIPAEKLKGLTQNQVDILKELLNNRRTVPELADRSGVSHQAIRKDMSKLINLDLVEKRGAARATYYVLKGDPTTT